MGSLFTTHKKSTLEVLEELERKIEKHEIYRRETQLNQKRFVAYFLILSIALYVAVIILWYIYFFPTSWSEGLTRVIPLALCPCMIWASKVAVGVFFSLRLERNDIRLSEFRREKKKILDEVKDKETYKVAKEILERYDPLAKLEKSAKEQEEARSRERHQYSLQVSNASPNLRRRTATPQATHSPGRLETSSDALLTPPPSSQRASSSRVLAQSTPRSASLNRSVAMTSPAPPTTTAIGSPAASTSNAVSVSPQLFPRLSAPVFPQERSMVDKLVDYVLGDGPSNRYALICKKCGGHNGMVLMEEFEYLAFRCCYCREFHPAKKYRGAAMSPAPSQHRFDLLNNSSESGNDQKEHRENERSEISDGNISDSSTNERLQAKADHDAPVPGSLSKVSSSKPASVASDEQDLNTLPDIADDADFEKITSDDTVFEK